MNRFARIPASALPAVVLCGLWLATLVAPAHAQTRPAGTLEVDLSAYHQTPDARVSSEPDTLVVEWTGAHAQKCVLSLNRRPAQPLIAGLGLREQGATAWILSNVNPVVSLTVGRRDLAAPAGWVAFFDNPAERPFQVFPLRFEKRLVRVTTEAGRIVFTVHDAVAGPFRGYFQFTVFPGSPLVLAEAVVRTEQDGCAILYDAGLTAPSPDTGGLGVRPPPWKDIAWLEASGAVRRAAIDLNHVASPVAVTRRAIAAEAVAGTVALFPPPHLFFYPLDFATNLGFAWYGSGSNWSLRGFGFGVHQPPFGDRRWVPWCNAPPHTDQRLGVFYHLSPGDAERALADVGRYSRDDRYKKLPGYVTFSSHYHFEHTLELTRRREERGDPAAIPAELKVPGFVQTFKARGIDIVHAAEFHVGGMPRLSAEKRLPLLRTLFQECERLSDREFLLLPGEEADVHLGGHWLALFPRPVYWILNRSAETAFVTNEPGFGKVYHVGNPDDVLRLMEAEGGLMWTAHPRIKGSREYPDQYFNTDFYRSDRFLGGAWKSMPVDNSLPRLGTRVFNLMDQTANRGERKYYVGEADLFRIEPDMETYGHLNINYLRLDGIPRFTAGWQPVLDALHGGKFFVSTGEVLIPEFTVSGTKSGGELKLPSDQRAELRVKLEWTFPLSFAEVVTGDGAKVFRQRIDLRRTGEFGAEELVVPLDLTGRTWVRFEVWDVARNGAFTPPVWLAR